MYRPNDAVVILFNSSGAPDVLPTVDVYQNGAIDVTVVAVVTEVLADQVYKVAFTVPVDYAEGDYVSVVASFLVSTVAQKQVVANELILPERVKVDMTQAVPAMNASDTVGDALNAARAQGFGKWVKDGTSLVIYRGDGTTVARSFILNDADTPTART